MVFNYEGIPMRFSQSLNLEFATNCAALALDYINTTKKLILKDMRQHSEQQEPNELETIRIRSRRGLEFIITHEGDYRMVCIQNCGGREEQEQEQAAN